MDSFCLLVEANGSVAIRIYSYSELKPELENSNVDLALIDEYVLFEGKKTTFIVKIYKSFICIKVSFLI